MSRYMGADAGLIYSQHFCITCPKINLAIIAQDNNAELIVSII